MSNTLVLPHYLAKELATAHRAYQAAQAKAARMNRGDYVSENERISVMLGNANEHRLAERTTHANFMGSLEEVVRWIDRHGRSERRVTAHDVHVDSGEALALVTLYRAWVNAQQEANQKIEDAREGVPSDGPSMIQFHMRDRMALLKPAMAAESDYTQAGVAFAEKLALLAETKQHNQEGEG